MDITVEKYIIEFDHRELWTLLFALKREVLSYASHYAMNQGMDTYEGQKDKHGREGWMVREISMRVGRIDIYEDMLSELEAAIRDAQEEMEEAKAKRAKEREETA